jgi:glyoxylase-like metal-dependent hydrolase (beta-lactamase superfamily II)
MINKIRNNVWQFHFQEFGSCVYLIKLNKKLILIDTSSKECEEELLKDLQRLTIKPEDINTIILTHNHYDHVENLSFFLNAKTYSLENINELKIPEFKIIKAPGHTKEDICILYENILFSGDVIFHNGYLGRTDFPESDPEEMEKSLEKLRKINFKTLCPGHIV